MAETEHPVAEREPGSGCGPLLLGLTTPFMVWLLVFSDPSGNGRADRAIAAIQSVKIAGVPVLALVISAFIVWQAIELIRTRLF
jgi:hypothetical protein